VVSTLCIYALNINLDALIVYANGIFIMIYLLCMLAGCRLLKGRYKALAVVGGAVPAAAGDGGMEESVRHCHAGGLWLFLALSRPGRRSATGQQNHRSSL
jgi:amino acid efflux transporter